MYFFLGWSGFAWLTSKGGGSHELLSSVFWGDVPPLTPSRVRPRLNGRPWLLRVSFTPPVFHGVVRHAAPARHSSLPRGPVRGFYLRCFLYFNVRLFGEVSRPAAGGVFIHV